MTTALVTGASGYLAHRLVPVVARHAAVIGVCRQPANITTCSGSNDNGSNRAGSSDLSYRALDITDPTATERTIRQINPDVIIHAAAANPGHDADTMWAVNFEATKTIARIAGELNVRMVFISTDIVHNGLQAPYADEAPANPVNAYGKSKAAGEAAVLETSKRAIVTRTSLIYGLEQIDRGTAGFKTTLEAGNELTLFRDVLRQPVWIDSLCHAICLLAFDRSNETGTINLVGDQVLSRANFALKMLRYWDVPTTGNITLTSAQTIAGLPLDCTMHLHRAKSLSIKLPGVDAVLAATQG